MEKLKILIYGIFAYLQVNHEAFTILIVLMLLDSILGALKAIRMGNEFEFRILIWGITMKLIFLLIPLVVALMGLALQYDFRLAVNVVLSILTVSEGYSILGNIYAAKNKVEVKKIDAISLVIVSLRHLISEALESLLDKLKNMGKK